MTGPLGGWDVAYVAPLAALDPAACLNVLPAVLTASEGGASLRAEVGAWRFALAAGGDALELGATITGGTVEPFPHVEKEVGAWTLHFRVETRLADPDPGAAQDGVRGVLGLLSTELAAAAGAEAGRTVPTPIVVSRPADVEPLVASLVPPLAARALDDVVGSLDAVLADLAPRTAVETWLPAERSAVAFHSEAGREFLVVRSGDGPALSSGLPGRPFADTARVSVICALAPFARKVLVPALARRFGVDPGGFRAEPGSEASNRPAYACRARVDLPAFGAEFTFHPALTGLRIAVGGGRIEVRTTGACNLVLGARIEFRTRTLHGVEAGPDGRLSFPITGEPKVDHSLEGLPHVGHHPSPFGVLDAIADELNDGLSQIEDLVAVFVDWLTGPAVARASLDEVTRQLGDLGAARVVDWRLRARPGPPEVRLGEALTITMDAREDESA